MEFFLIFPLKGMYLFTTLPPACLSLEKPFCPYRVGSMLYDIRLQRNDVIRNMLPPRCNAIRDISQKKYIMRVPAGRPPAGRAAPKRVSRDGVACCPCRPYTARNSLSLSALPPKQQPENQYPYTARCPTEAAYTADPQRVALLPDILRRETCAPYTPAAGCC